jgi:broad specificity phosphatase PhoE
VRRLLLVRHARATSNVRDVVSSTPPGEGLSPEGVEQALALRATLAAEPIELAFASRLVRTQETLALALGDRPVARTVLPELDEIGFGGYDGGPLAAYREWAWTTPPAEDPPGGGESRVALALRVARALEALLDATADVVLAVGHALPLRYALDGAAGVRPRARMTPVPHALPHALPADAVERSIAALRTWVEAPAFADELGAASLDRGMRSRG